ncbi:MAG: energy-coupling factor transporter transmembrane component T [Nitrososphaerota archaeon]
MKSQRDEKTDWHRLFLETSSKINPLTAQITILLILAAITIETNHIRIFLLLIVAFTISSVYSRKTLSILKFILLFTPLSMGLGIFYGLISGKSLLEAVFIMWMRIGTLVSISTLLYYCVDPWELADSLTRYLRFPRTLGYSIGIAFSVYQKMMRDLREAIDSLRSRKIIRSWLDYLLKIDKILYITVYIAYRRAEELEIVLEARSFDPYWRRERKRLKIKLKDYLTLIFTSLSTILVMFLVG